jgi:hypothetical protein
VVVFLCIGAAVSGLAQAGDTPPRKVTVKAGMEGDAEAAGKYLKANDAFVRETMPKAVRTCASATAAAEVTSFDLTITVVMGGKVVGTTANPTNAFTSCVSEAVKSSVLTKPPRVPTDVYLEVTIAR